MVLWRNRFRSWVARNSWIWIINPSSLQSENFFPKDLPYLLVPLRQGNLFRSLALPLRCERGACLGLRNGKRNRIISLFGGQSIPSTKQNPYHNRWRACESVFLLGSRLPRGRTGRTDSKAFIRAERNSAHRHWYIAVHQKAKSGL